MINGSFKHDKFTGFFELITLILLYINTHELYTNQEETRKLPGNPCSKTYLNDSHFTLDCLVFFSKFVYNIFVENKHIT